MKNTGQKSIADRKVSTKEIEDLSAAGQTVVLRHCDLTGLNLSQNDMSGWRFEQCILAGASFNGAMLEGTVFEGCRAAGG